MTRRKMARMGKLDRILELVHLLADSHDGVTLDEMAAALEVNRRTAERMRDVVREHFDLDECTDDRQKRFRIDGPLRRLYFRPNAAEMAALQVEAELRRREGAPHAALLESLLVKVKAGMDSRERTKLGPDLEPLARLQRTPFHPGPRADVDPMVLATLQGAIMAGTCVEFEYQPVDADEYRWRQLVPYGLILGPVAYLVGQLVKRGGDPVTFRLDRMREVRRSSETGLPPVDWNLDSWMDQSVGIWREEEYDVVLRVLPHAVQQARHWQFHPRQVLEESDSGVIVRFRSGGLWQIVDHVFTWGGDLVIEAPKELQEVMQERLEALSGQLGS